MDASEPPIPPRKFNLNGFYKTLPANVQIGVFAVPLSYILLIIILVNTPTIENIKVIGAGIFGFLALSYFLYRHYSFYTHSPHVSGKISNISRPEDFSISHLKILHYNYQYNYQEYSGEHMVDNKSNYKKGDKVFILINVAKPKKSTLWVCSKIN